MAATPVGIGAWLSFDLVCVASIALVLVNSYLMIDVVHAVEWPVVWGIQVALVALGLADLERRRA